MTDRELLEKAAKAAGVPWADGRPSRLGWANWNPLTNDGDALRLAVKLRLSIRLYESEAGAQECRQPYGSDPCAATRRAIVRAAAALEDR